MTNFIRYSLSALTLVSLLGCRAEPPDALPQGQSGEPVADPVPVAAQHPTSGADMNAAPPADHVHAQASGGMPTPAGVGVNTPRAAGAEQEAGVNSTSASQGPPASADEPTTHGEARGVQWAVPTRWPLAGEEDEFRVRTWRLPALSMAGAGECVLYRFPGGGDLQANLKRWMGQFRGLDGTVESVVAEQAQRVIQGLPAWLVRAQGTYVSQGQKMDGPAEEFENYALFGAVVVAEGDPAFVKCTGPMAVIAYEADAILALIDSLLVTPN